jgi:hypothetical protein
VYCLVPQDADLIIMHEQERLVQDKGGWRKAYCMPQCRFSFLVTAADTGPPRGSLRKPHFKYGIVPVWSSDQFGLTCYPCHAGDRLEEWEIIKIWFAGRLFNDADELLAAWQSDDDGLRSSFNFEIPGERGLMWECQALRVI